MRVLNLFSVFALVFTAIAAPVDNNVSPASPLLDPPSCFSPACVLITFADYTQVNYNNVQCVNFGQEVIGVLVAECYCTLWENQGCSGIVEELSPCPGLINEFPKPVRSISCGGWSGPSRPPA